MANLLIETIRDERAREGTTPQWEQADPSQVQNSAGGFSFVVTDKDRLERFLILGTASGTYYIDAIMLTKDNIDFVRKMVRSDERLLVDTAVDVSVNARAYSNSAAIFALAVALVDGEDKAYTREAILKVARTSTMIFELADYIKNLGGWGRAKRAAIAGWYEKMDKEGRLPYQVVKYRQRNGWTHRDLLRLAHPSGLNKNTVNFVLDKPLDGPVDPIIAGFRTIQSQTELSFVLNNLELWSELPWEAIPTQFLVEPEVWKRLFANGQLKGQALLRNITRLARIGAFDDMEFVRKVADVLTTEWLIEKTRLHPINYLNAAIAYEEGPADQKAIKQHRDWGGGIMFHVPRLSRQWTINSVIRDALKEGFHLAFKNVTPAGKRTLFGVDVSGSMAGPVLGLNISCAQAAAVMAMQLARTEPMHMIMGFSTHFVDLGISANDSFDSAFRKVNNAGWGGTDCALPMVWALGKRIEVDTFGVLTDNETWFGGIHPFQALKKYRAEMGIDARLAVFGLAATPFTIADPSDKGMMDFVGLDASAPRAFADFSAGRL